MGEIKQQVEMKIDFRTISTWSARLRDQTNRRRKLEVWGGDFQDVSGNSLFDNKRKGEDDVFHLEKI